MEESETETINGRTYTSAFTTSNETYVKTTPAGRRLTIELDGQEIIAATQVGDLLPTEFTYDSRGRMASMSQGTRSITFDYDTAGFLARVVDPLRRHYNTTYDLAGHPLSLILPDGRSVGFAYDAAGNIVSLTTPSNAIHKFSYTPVSLPSAYIPPALAGTKVPF